MRFSFLVICIIFLCCKEVRLTIQGASYCASSKIHLQTQVPNIEEAKSIIEDTELRKYFSPKSIRLAIAYNLVNELKPLLKLKLANNKNNLEIQKVEYRIYKKIFAMSIDVDSITSEFSCYVDRFTEILVIMKEKEDDIVRNNTLFAIMLGAFAAILDGGTQANQVINRQVIVGGGLGVAYFSYKSFNPKITIEFKPKSTNLKDIWFNPTTTENYSKPLWFLMTQNIIKDELPIRDLLVKRWIENNFLGNDEEREKYVDLFFGKGGVSTISDITNRREMNNEVRSMVYLLKQEIKGFEIELQNLF